MSTDARALRPVLPRLIAYAYDMALATVLETRTGPDQVVQVVAVDSRTGQELHTLSFALGERFVVITRSDDGTAVSLPAAGDDLALLVAGAVSELTDPPLSAPPLPT